MFYYIGLIVGAIFIFLGLEGSVLPVLPGPPLSFLGLFLCAFVRDFSPPLTPTLIMMMLMVTIAVTVVDYFIPLIGAKKYGTSSSNQANTSSFRSRNAFISFCSMGLPVGKASF